MRQRSHKVAAESALTIEDLRQRSVRYLPRILFDWIDGGAGDEHGLRRNQEVFRSFSFLPRYLEDLSRRSQQTTLLGQSFDHPFGIAPMGYTGLFRPGCDLLMAKAASEANIPFILSGTSTDSIERIVEVASTQAWYQLYGAADFAITSDLIRRAEMAGCKALVITVDIPIAAKRERDLRNGFTLPLTMTPRMILDGVTHPRWTACYLASGGTPMMENWAPYAPRGSNALQVAEFANAHSYCEQTWEHLKRFRELWPRKLIVKGVMHPGDAARAIALGADGLIVSNHGGRQFDRAPTAPEVFAMVRAEVPPEIPVMLDGGIRRGSDILASLALGASFIFIGRAMLYGAVAHGGPGVARAIAILVDELDQLMAQTGSIDLSALPDDLLRRH